MVQNRSLDLSSVTKEFPGLERWHGALEQAAGTPDARCVQYIGYLVGAGLQVPGYNRATLGRWMGPDQTERCATAREERVARLRHIGFPVVYVMGESTLRQSLFGKEIMRPQLVVMEHALRSDPAGDRYRILPVGDMHEHRQHGPTQAMTDARDFTMVEKPLPEGGMSVRGFTADSIVELDPQEVELRRQELALRFSQAIFGDQAAGLVATIHSEL